MENENATGALRKEKDEMDQRDFNGEYLVEAITDEQLANVPKVVDLIAEINETYKQGSIGCCTATALCHTVLIQNIFDFKSNKIRLDQKYQWTNNQRKQRTSNESGDYVENALKGARKNGIQGKLVDGSDFSFKMDGYFFEAVDANFERFLKIIAYNLNRKIPMYWTFRGNSLASSEMSQGELKTVYKITDCNRGHAIVLGKIDFNRRVVGIGNSRNRNTTNKEGNQTISMFEISFDVFEQLIKNKIFAWRYRKVLDFKDIKVNQLFLDFAITDETNEAYQAVKRAKDAGYIKGVPATGGNRLYPDRPMTRLEVILFLHRILSGK